MQIVSWIGAHLQSITLKAPSISVAYNILILFQKKIKLGYSCELSAKQTIHMKCQALFSLKCLSLLSEKKKMSAEIFTQ